MAVLEVLNKRGGGVFDKQDEHALVRLCACVESLLRRKAAEVALLKSGMTERSWIRSNSGRGGGHGSASSNYARVESTIMRLYSESAPADMILREREKATPGAGRAALGGHRSRSPNDGGAADADCDWQTRKGSGNGRHSEASGGGGGGGDSCRERLGVSDGGLTGHDSGIGGRGGAELSPRTVLAGEERGEGDGDRVPVRAAIEDHAELADLSMNMFDLSSAQQLSLVKKFVCSMGLMDTFQVRFVLTYMLFSYIRSSQSFDGV